MSETAGLTQGRRINVLSAHVANAIAAGEVVERPASVVKELCENAIDAQATSIAVRIEGGGLSLLSVIDDGVGIPSDDLPLALARHATSKISTVDDLMSAQTLGFRGEALASIAAVSRMTLRSATEESRNGREIVVAGADTVADLAAAAVRGTTVEVRELFFNTPARLRFLRAERTETSRAVRVVSELALSHPHIRFRCDVDSRNVLTTSGQSLLGSIRAVFGKQDAESALEVRGTDETSVTGYIGQPHRHRGQRNAMVIIVNGRRVHNRALYVAVENSYRSLIPSGRFPFCVLRVDLQPEMVDANVHPAKTEVRFTDDRAVFAAIERACWSALNGVTLRAPVPHGRGTTGSTTPLAIPNARAGVEMRGQVLSFADATLDTFWQPAKPSDSREVTTTPEQTLTQIAPLRAVGQINNQWLVAESPVGLVVVDPHAAHEKVLYTHIMARDTQALGSQLLLVPVVIDLNPTQMAAAAKDLEQLQEMGFTIEEFGPTSVRCTSVPSSAQRANIERVVTDLIDELSEPTDPQTKRHKTAALVACHSAVRLGDALGHEEQQRLLDELTAAPRATTCPHGRPTTFVLNDNDLRKAFTRPV